MKTLKKNGEDEVAEVDPPEQVGQPEEEVKAYSSALECQDYKQEFLEE